MTISLETVVLAFLSGVIGGNAFPHFVRGITREAYPNVFGNGPVTNVVTGWAGLVIAAALAYYANFQHNPLESLLIGSLGVLLMGLFHARVGAFGRSGLRRND